MKISIQGIKGAFHEEAARLYFKDDITIVENLTFEQVIESVTTEKSDAGIMAIENTISGTIHSNLELIKNAKLLITGEIYLRIEQNLAVNKGVKIHELKQVESHFMAINQCRSFFQNHPNIKLVDMEDTALSMKNISENKLTTVGAIGSQLAAEYYNLDIIGESIETDKENFTRFLIFGSQSLGNENTNKASIHIVLKNNKGQLAKILNIINNNDIDLSKIESLPIIGKPWQYQFYLDLLYPHISNYDTMIREVKPHLESLSALGNYNNKIVNK